MANKSRFSIAKPRIEHFFNETSPRVYALSELTSIYKQNKREWNLAEYATAEAFIEYLEERSHLQRVVFEYNVPITRFIWGAAPVDLVYPLAMSLKANSYFSHYTAMVMNNLTDQNPKTIYVTYEQPPKKPTGSLTQANIDLAFQGPGKPPAQTSAALGDYTITLLNGKNTGNRGVIRGDLRVTDIERTLIDIIVKPNYSGGIHEVMKAYQRARGRASVNKINAHLAHIKYIYPYHQAIGFCLEQAGWPEKRLKIIESNDMRFDFYLLYGMKDMSYSERWRLYYPTYLNNNNDDQETI